MRKTIKIEDSTYDKLEEFRGKRETFSDAIDRAMGIAADARALVALAKTNPEYQAWKAKHDK